ncbi:Pollen Ole e 1 allergen/extensin [Quillaja saponaria]|uniref:Pollen Ole e 1 allergen/extensin n=1 Tax=Quillaja saponaria TaxID=32244 RepID=A0AAD7VCM0_QUISA|nr:Pollen Ole e 1 allergen/extensin [Quillaja saponaria]
MSWFLIILFLSFTFNSLSEASHEKKLPSAVVVGTVYCDTCFQEDFSMSKHFISGASVSVECKDGSSKQRFWKEVKTDEHGEFKVHLPFSVSKHVKKIKGCSVKLISSSEPYCAVASTATSSLHLKSRKPGEHIFSAGFFSFKPLKQPTLCNQKSSIKNSKEFSSMKSLLPPINDPTFPPPLQNPPMLDLPPLGQILPPLPGLPGLPRLPELPPLPPLQGLPKFPPAPGKPEESNPTESSKISQFSGQKVAQPQFFFPPNPLLQPPIIPNRFQLPPLIPNPFQPPPLIPPIPGLTPPTTPVPLIPLPPIPGLTTPSPPPPPPPTSLPFPFPPIIPFPASTSSPWHSPYFFTESLSLIKIKLFLLDVNVIYFFFM